MLATWEGALLLWFADGDLGIFAEPTQTNSKRPRRSTPITVRLEDLRYGWASPNARGMWGLEAKFLNGERISPIRRIARPTPTAMDASRIGGLLLGRLPKASSVTSGKTGWHRPELSLIHI